MVTPPTVSPGWDMSTAGCSGADGFLRCAVTYSADARVVPRVNTVAPILRITERISDGDRCPEEIDPTDRAGPEVTAEDLLINRAEVDRELEVAGRVQVGEARLGSIQPALDGVADQQQR